MSPIARTVIVLSAVLSLLFGAVTAIAAPDAAPQALDTRAAIHENYARLVFDGTATGAAFSATPDLAGTQLTISFDHPVTLLLDKFKARLSAYLDDIALDPDGTKLTAHLRKKVTLRQFHLKSGVEAIDLLVAADPAAAPETPQPTNVAAKPMTAAPSPLPAETTPDPPSTKPTATPHTAAPEASHPTSVAAKPVAAPPTSATPTPGAPTPLHAGAVSVSPAAKPAVTSPAVPVKSQAELAEKKAPEDDADDDAAPVAASKPEATKPGKATPETQKQVAAAAPVPDAPAVGSEGGLHLKTILGDDGTISLRLDWTVMTSAAVFRRDNAVWIVFDRAEKFDPADALVVSNGGLASIAQISSHSGTVIRAVTKDPLFPWVRRAGMTWIIDLKARKQPVESPILPIIRKDGTSSIADFQALDPGAPVGVIDPETRDVVIAVPLPQLGQASENTSEYPDFRVLTTTQGLAFRPYTDQLSVKQQAAQVEVTAPAGLTLSSSTDREMSPRSANANYKLLSPRDWMEQPGVDFRTRRANLRYAISLLPAANRTNPRVDLAKFYFANGLAAEALGVLRTAEADVPNLADDPAVRLLQGACELMMNQIDLAATDLGNGALDGRADTLMWRADLAAAQGNWHDAAALALQGKDVLVEYSRPLIRKMALPAAEALLRSGNFHEASELADKVLDEDPSQGERDLALVIKGRLAGENGDVATAMNDWQRAAASPVADLGRAEANFALVATKLDQGKMSLTDAIDAMDRMRYVWRGDDFEITVLRKLADLYAKDANYRLAFQTLQRIPTIVPDSTAAKDAAARMQSMFTDLFLGPDADKVPPISSVAIYEEFKELTPTGDKGDEIIRKLADRLVAVDLLDRAGDLLLDQAKNRLTGTPQARVALQLALVRLMDHRPQDAVAALDLISPTGLPPELVAQQQELRARALAELDQPDAALKVLDGDTSVDADKLRADIYFKAQRWLPLATLLQKNLQGLPTADPLNATQAATVLRTAICLVLGGDQNGLASLQQRFGSAMDNSPEYKDGFRVVAGGIDAKAADFQTLADKVAQVGDLQSFMSSYRQKVQQDKLSAIN